jgi:hypothetical protein
MLRKSEHLRWHISCRILRCSALSAFHRYAITRGLTVTGSMQFLGIAKILER